jgi:hypothetical protein
MQKSLIGDQPVAVLQKRPGASSTSIGHDQEAMHEYIGATSCDELCR